SVRGSSRGTGRALVHRRPPDRNPRSLETADSLKRTPAVLDFSVRGAMRALAGILALLVAGGCASKPAPPPPGASPSPPPPVAAEPAPPKPPAPFSDKELADELVRRGVGTSRDAPTSPPSQSNEELPTEIRQTPRGVVVTFRSVF